MKNIATPTLFVAFSHQLTKEQREDFFSLVCKEQFSTFRVNSSDRWIAQNQFMETIAEIVSLSAVAPELQAQMSQIPATATLSEIQELAKAIVVEAVKAGATHFFCTGEPTLTLWANLYAGSQSDFMLDLGYIAYTLGLNSGHFYYGSESFKMICIQSTTERRSVEVTNPDGTVTKTQIFSHVQWREMF